MNNKNFSVKFSLNSFYDNEKEIKEIHCPSGNFESFDKAFHFLVVEGKKLWDKICNLGVEIEKHTAICFEFSFKVSNNSSTFDKLIWWDYYLIYEQNKKRIEIPISNDKYEPEFYDFLFGFCSCLQANNLMIKDK